MTTSKNKLSILKKSYNKAAELQYSSLGVFGAGLLGFVFVIFSPELLKTVATVTLLGLFLVFFDILEVLLEEAVVRFKNRKNK